MFLKLVSINTAVMFWTLLGCSLKSAEEIKTLKDVSLSDPNIEYIGRWDKSDSSLYHSYWGGAYFRLRFSGTSISVKLAETSDFYAFIDGVRSYYSGVKGNIDLTSTRLQPGNHTLMVVARFQSDELQVQGFSIDEDATILAPESTKKLIEFIGNSITTGDRTTKGDITAFPWLTAEALGCDHTQISFCGITLTDGYRYTYSGAPYWGMSLQYFWTKEPNYKLNPDWNFTQYTPQLIVINLGTNDSFTGVPSTLFQSTYITFLENVRAKNPNAIILCMRTFNGYFETETSNAVTQRNNAGDAKVYYLDTNGWITTSDMSDGVHPTDSGHQKIADKLVSVLSLYLQ